MNTTHCVCGHPSSDHQTAAMAVKLPYKTPLYPPTTTFIYSNSITRTTQDAPYDRDECHCGCGEFLPDTGTQK